MRVRLKHSKKFEKNSGHCRLQIHPSERDTHHPKTIVVYRDSSHFEKYVTYKDQNKHNWDFKGTMTSLPH